MTNVKLEDVVAIGTMWSYFVCTAEESYIAVDKKMYEAAKKHLKDRGLSD